MNTAGYSTAGEVLNRAAIQVGVDTAPDWYSSTNPDAIKLTECLRMAGEELLTEVFGHLTSSVSFLGTGAIQQLELSADVGTFLEGGCWDSTDRVPLIGPMHPSELQAAYYALGFGTSDLSRMFGRIGNTLSVPGYIPLDHLYIFSYVSKWWVKDDTLGVPSKGAPAAMADVVVFDPLLIVLATKFHFLTMKGLDNSVAYSQLRARIEHVRGRDAGATVKSMTGGTVGTSATPWIGSWSGGNTVLG
jgi:hypothetical protein